MNARLLTLSLGLAALLAVPAAIAGGGVGFVTVDLQPGLNLITNPLNGPDDPFSGVPDNSLDITFILSDFDIGATIYRFDEATQSYGDPIQWAGTSLGWLTANLDPNWLILAPGEAFWIQVFSPASHVWVGTVEGGTLSNPLPGGGELSMRASILPLPGQLAFPGVGLEFPGATGDTIYVWDPFTQNYKQPYQYLDGLGWLSANADDEGLDGPTIEPGTGFFLQKFGPPVSWDQDFPAGATP